MPKLWSDFCVMPEFWISSICIVLLIGQTETVIEYLGTIIWEILQRQKFKGWAHMYLMVFK